MTPERIQRLSFALANRQPDLSVILENVHNPNNVSAVMRTCDAVGIQELFVLNTQQPPMKNWGRRSNAGTAGWLDVWQYDAVTKLIADLRKKYLRIFASTLKINAKNLFDLDLTQNIAFVFGNEKDGVSRELTDVADECFTIPQVGLNPSLNISVACAVTVYEAFRQKQKAGHYKVPRLGAADTHRLIQKWKLEEAGKEQNS